MMMIIVWLLACAWEEGSGNKRRQTKRRSERGMHSKKATPCPYLYSSDHCFCCVVLLDKLVARRDAVSSAVAHT